MNFILDNIVSPVVGFFRDFLLEQVLLTIQVGDKVDALCHNAAVLKEKCQTVKNTVEAQERDTSKKCTAEVQGWLRRAEEILRISQEIEVDYENRNCMLGTWCSLNCCSNYSISLRTISVHQRVNDALGSIAKVTDYVADVAPPSVQETNTSVAPTSASGQLKAMQEKALSFIHKDTRGTLGIWGMGGVGKTTLLQLINNSLMADTFTVIFVVASSGCTEAKLREIIAKNQGLSMEGDLKKTIFEFLKGKDFVLLVDDLWDRLNLEDIGVPLPLGTYNGHRRKLILTTRDLHVCGGMGAGDNVIKLECLKWKEAWALFQKNVGEVYEEGQVIIDKLLKACLLENVKESYKTPAHLKNSCVKMHDLTRDMALWVARECGANKKKWQQVLTDHGKEEASEEAHKISIMYTKTKVLTSRIRNWPNLTTLILRQTSSLKDEDVTNIQYCSLLKYLDVSDNG